MKKISSIILAGVLAASMIAGCSSEAATSESTAASSALTETSASSEVVVTEATQPQTFEDLYGNQITTYLDHQYYFDGEPVPITFSNFSFLNDFYVMTNYANMGYYPITNIGYLDLAASCDAEEYDTYGDVFLHRAEYYLQYSCIVLAKAEEAGYSLPEERQAEIDQQLESMADSAANSGLTLDEYIKLWIGPNCDADSYRDILEKMYIVNYYPDAYCDNYEYTDEEKFAPNIRYALFYAPEEAEQADKDSALENAQSMLDSCSSIDDITGLAETAYASAIVSDYGDISVPRGKTVADFEDWAYGEDRYEGEMDIVYSAKYGYFVVGYLGREEMDEETLRSATKTAFSNEVDSEITDEIHEFYTDDEYGTAPEGPTATATPTSVAEAFNFDSDPTTPVEQTVPSNNSSMTATDILVVVFLTLAGVAVLAVVVILIRYAMKNGKKDGDGSEGIAQTSGKSYIDDDEEEFFKDIGKDNDEEPEEEPEESEEDEDEPAEEEEEPAKKEEEPEKPAPAKNNSGSNKNSSKKKNKKKH